MHYSDNPADVKVSFFKKSGKWYTDECVRWTGEYKGNKQLIHDAFAKSLRDHFRSSPGRLDKMDAVCLEPYHEHSHPIMIKGGKWNDYNL